VAGIEKNLNVPWQPQRTLHFCGPAVAQMFLDFVNVGVSQADLWNDITNKTVGSRPPDAPPTDHAFPQQVCDSCDLNSTDPERWQCWDTTPEALSATVAARAGVALDARYVSTFDQGVEMLIDSLDRTPEVPAFATIHLINHWVLVKGYVRDDFASTEAPARQVGRYNLNGLYIHDPQELDEDERVRLVTVNDWRGKFGLVGCGAHIDTHPIVVVGTARLATWIPSAAALLLLLLLYLIWKWFVGG
jgi:hypothetical protein